MKNKNITISNEEARIYRNYYRPSLNPLRLLISILSIFVSGSSPAATSSIRRK